ncbi:trimethyllysine dioxygenase [Xylona heveae TC161]|uniref:Trimethyllysine dioxygenase n=1 Tax=Xylona heveae (strain CBS 132557 / TC161) TaxID=1328760 RepID=A0A164ZZJ5_XYLHT|nr:trimethyllysine dioxygenase [Xylona heveae TC161]KZF19744.1 trimethyllysine dioxygenase [Xylona heveae TC161]
MLSLALRRRVALPRIPGASSAFPRRIVNSQNIPFFQRKDLACYFSINARQNQSIVENEFGSAQAEPTAFSDDKAITVQWPDKTPAKFLNLWLRDHCQCSACVHQDTKQRLLDSFALPRDIYAKAVIPSPKGLHVKWNSDGHESIYDWDWLHLHRHFPKRPMHDHELPSFKLWGSEIRNSPPTVQYKDIMSSEEGVGGWLMSIHRFGFASVEGCPASPEATEELLERISFIRHTHYGGFWDFTSDLASKDTAYTSLALNAHTDTTYFSDPAGLQLFHLLSHTQGEGGASLLVDGFRAAHILKKEAPEAYRILSQVRVPSHASGNEGISIQPYTSFPILNHHPVTGELIQVRWNNDDRATMDEWENEEDVERWYDAARKWANILRREESEYWEQLQPGRPLIFDNWRILHGRSAFTGKRRLCGGYINRDDFISRLRMTNWNREQILKAL